MLARRHPRRRDPRRGVRSGARAVLAFALISLGLLVAQAARVGHLALVSHSLCEHGALIHADEVAPAHAAASDHEAPLGVDPGAAHPGHEHCDPLGLKALAPAVGPACPDCTLLDGELLPWSVRPRPGERVISRHSH